MTFKKYLPVLAALILFPAAALAQYRTDSLSTRGDTLVLTLDDALRIALSENVSVKVADKEIQRLKYAKAGSYSALFPQINFTGSYQRTIKKQVMYMGGNDDGEEGGGGMSSMFSGIMEPIMYYIQQLYQGTGVPYVPYVAPETETTSSSNDGIEVGRWNTWSAGISASMPIINAQLWESIKVSGQQVELAVEKARESRLGMVSSVKNAYYGVLLAKEVFNVYKSVYENALENLQLTEKKYEAQKASELDLARAKTTFANAIPNVYNAESSIILGLWQLKAVIGMDLDENIDIAGSLDDYADHMFYDIHQADSVSLNGNTTMRQLELQAEQLASAIRMNAFAFIPTLSASFSYSYNAMANDFKFKQYQWTPYSFVGISLNIPIFTGAKRIFDIKQSKLQAAELDLQKQNTERQLRISVRQSVQSMETAMQTYTAAKDALESAEKAYDIAAKSYDVGRSTLTDLDNAQLGLTQAKLSVSQAIYSFITAKTGLEQTIGCDFLDDQGKVDLDGSYK